MSADLPWKAILEAFNWICKIGYGISRLLSKKPFLTFEFNPEDGGIVVTPVTQKNPNTGQVIREGLSGSYIRVKLINKGAGVAKKCRPFLEQIEFRETDNMGSRWKSVFSDPLPLRWSYKHEQNIFELDFSRHEGNYIDICCCIQHSKIFRPTLPHDHPSPELFNIIFNKQGLYRFKIIVRGENVVSSSGFIVVQWNEKYPIERARFETHR